MLPQSLLPLMPTLAHAADSLPAAVCLAGGNAFSAASWTRREWREMPACDLAAHFLAARMIRFPPI